MAHTNDPFNGTWRLNPGQSAFDPNHRPRTATMVIEQSGAATLIKAEGINEKGEPVTERPQEIIADGQPHPVPGFPGLVIVATQPDARTLHSEVRREDGSIAGGGTYTLSTDGRSLRAVNFGFDSQLREFRQQTVWDRLN
jgi:hypothetical protein